MKRKTIPYDFRKHRDGADAVRAANHNEHVAFVYHDPKANEKHRLGVRYPSGNVVSFREDTAVFELLVPDPAVDHPGNKDELTESQVGEEHRIVSHAEQFVGELLEWFDPFKGEWCNAAATRGFAHNMTYRTRKVTNPMPGQRFWYHGTDGKNKIWGPANGGGVWSDRLIGPLPEPPRKKLSRESFKGNDLIWVREAGDTSCASLLVSVSDDRIQIWGATIPWERVDKYEFCDPKTGAWMSADGFANRSV